MVSVCVGDAFGTDADGKLILLLDGNPPAVNNPWPTGCNPARVDPNGGLWVPPDHDVLFVDGAVETDDSTTFLDGTRQNLMTGTVDVTNPSECRSMRLLVAISVDLTVDIGPGEAVGCYVEYDNGPGVFAAPDRLWRIPHAGAGFVTWGDERNIQRTGLLDEGDTNTLRVRVAVEASPGPVSVFSSVTHVAVKFRVWGFTRG